MAQLVSDRVWSTAAGSPIVVSWDEAVIVPRLPKCPLRARADAFSFGHRCAGGSCCHAPARLSAEITYLVVFAPR
jgi:hypothetical protein